MKHPLKHLSGECFVCGGGTSPAVLCSDCAAPHERLNRLTSWSLLWKRARDHFAWLVVDAPVGRLGRRYIVRAKQAHERWLLAQRAAATFLDRLTSDESVTGQTLGDLIDAAAKRGEKLH